MSNNVKANILLVDDQPSKLMSYEVILGQLGENLIKANSAREALECLLRTEIAVVLVDACMPDMDGFELASLIRKHPRCDRTAIILVSAVYLSDLDRLRGYGAGAVDYVPVPIVPEVLRAKVSIFADLFRKTKQLSRINDELERRVAERTAALEASAAELRISEAREREARTVAERANKLRDEFLATLSHELRTPINAVLGWVQLLQRGSLDDETRGEGLRIIENGVRAQVRLIEELLDVNRIASGKFQINNDLFMFAEPFQAAVSTILPQITAKGLKFLQPPTLPEVALRGDATRLQQVIWNLLSNATKFTPAGGSIEITVESSPRSVRFSIRDSGQGIAPDVLPHVFERFRQADSSTTRRHGGLGLGLTIARHIVEQHRGTIVATSDGEGRGACLTVTLPIESVAGIPELPPPARFEGGVDLRGLQILIVDDDRATREIVARIVGDCGAETRLAAGADEAIALFRACRPDLLVCDIAMPEKDGYALLAELRALNDGATVPALALTAYTRAEDRSAALAAGYQQHLGKPIDPSELLAAVVALTPARSAALVPAIRHRAVLARTDTQPRESGRAGKA